MSQPTSADGSAHAPSDARPPLLAPPAGAKPVVVTLRLSAKDAPGFSAHLRDVIPVTRLASGCRSSHTYQSPDAPTEFMLLQGWDSVEQQRNYIQWREGVGHLAHFTDQLSKPPVVDVFSLIDA